MEIQDMVELQHYNTIGKLVCEAIRVEMQIKRRSASRKTYIVSSGWKGKEKEKEKVRREKSPKKGSDHSLGQKEITSTPTPNAPRTNGRSCVNMASERLVKKLGLPTFVHPRPYKLQWLCKRGEFLMDKKVEVDFTLGRYEDKVTCYVVPMEVTHLLLGRSWQFD
ncbi:hypothetical protein CR513_33127, partial [Mucuna pruriens]